MGEKSAFLSSRMKNSILYSNLAHFPMVLFYGGSDRNLRAQGLNSHCNDLQSMLIGQWDCWRYDQKA